MHSVVQCRSMEGYLHKRGRGKSISIYKPYARRYFVLSEDTCEMSYFTDESKKSYRGMVNIEGSQVTELSKASTGKSFCFDLKCNVGKPHEETITLAAPNDNQLVQWIHSIHELGGGEVTWLPERVKAQDMAAKQKQELKADKVPGPQPTQNTNTQTGWVDDNDPDTSGHVKTGTLILQATSPFLPWQRQHCSLSYDFKELSLLGDEGNGSSTGTVSPKQASRTIELTESFLVDVKNHPRQLNVLPQPSSSQASQVDIVAMFQVFFMDASGKQSYSFAFQSAAECEAWRRALKVCGCDCEGGDGEGPSPHSGLPPNPPLSPGTYQPPTDDYEMNDIDEDSVQLQQLQQQQQQQSDDYEMNDIDEDSVPPGIPQFQDNVKEDTASTGSPPSASDNSDKNDKNDTDNVLFRSDDNDDKYGDGKMDGQMDEDVHEESGIRGSNVSTTTEGPPSPMSSPVHPRAHLFQLLNRNGSGALSLTEFMVGLRRREDVAKALQLPSNSKQEDGSRDRCVAAFNAMDDDDTGIVDERKFLQYMDVLDAKARRQQLFKDDPTAFYINSNHHDEHKHRSSMNPTSANLNSPPTSTSSSTPGSSSKSNGNSRSSFYGKIARKIQSESAHKRNVSVAISSENIPSIMKSLGINKPTDRGIDEAFMHVEAEPDFLEEFRTKNGMNTPHTTPSAGSGTVVNVPLPLADERKTTDTYNQGGGHTSASSLFGSVPLGGNSPPHAGSGAGAQLGGGREVDAESLLSDLKFIVLEAEHPARGVRTRLRLRELFHNDISSTIDFATAQQFFHENNCANSSNSSSSSLPDLFPFLTAGACSWHDCNRYLQHYEHKIKPSSSEFKIKIEISLPISGYSCILTSPVLNWVQKAARKIKTLPLSGMHVLSQEEITEVIERKHCVDFANQLTTLCLIEMSGAENYVQFLEETTQCFAKTPRTAIGATGKFTGREDEDKIDKSFATADIDKDGSISRHEWRRLMSEREGIVRAANEDKQKLIEENNRLRKALNIDSLEFSRERLLLKESRADNYERYLDVKNEEIAELKMELDMCKQDLRQLEQERDKYKLQRPAASLPQRDDATMYSFEEEPQQQMYELPDDDNHNHVQHSPPSPPPSPPLSVAMSINASLPPLSIPDHYSEHEARHQQERRQQFVDRLLTSRVYSQEETTGWARNDSPSPHRRKLVIQEGDMQVPPSLNEIARRQLSPERGSQTHTPTATPDKVASIHPLRQAFIHNTKSLDLTPLAATSLAIGTHTPKNKTPHKSFKDHTTSSRSKKLPEVGTGLFSGVRSPGAWSNSQTHLPE